MKLIKLSFQAFGPYVGYQEIDFESFQNTQTGTLLLICGPTGAGKSTIIDAITYALYGETSTVGRDAERMRSHFSQGASRTEVTLEFQIGNQRYKVYRSPRQELLKAHGGGFKKHEAQAILYDYQNQPIATKITDVTQQIEKIIGLDSKQFRQVVILPQGRFREFLNADVRTRETILEKIFQTTYYRQIQDELKARTTAIEKQYESLNLKLEVLFNNYHVGSIEELKQQETVLTQEGHSIKALVESHAQQLDIAETQLHKAKAIAEKFNEFEVAKREYEKMQHALINLPNLAMQRLKAKKAADVLGYQSEVEHRLKDLRQVESQIRLVKLQQAKVQTALEDILENDSKGAQNHLHKNVSTQAAFDFEEKKSYIQELRNELEPDSPCPVCGSLEHPGFSKNEKEIQQFREQLKNLAFQLQHLELQLNQTHKAYTKANAEFDIQQRNNGFEKIEDYQAAVLSSSELESLEAQIALIQTRQLLVKSRFEEKSKAILQLPFPDLPTLQSQYESAKKQVSLYQYQLGQWAAKFSQWQTALKSAVHIQAELELVDERIAVLAPLSAAANGANKKNLTWQRYMLTTMLDQVLLAASQQLSQTSQGRYQLRRSLQILDGRSAAGLDLEVTDEFTGQSRPVSTLSGGESFLAALALALGLADIVQSHTGRIRLETLFIDEGFGSLDSQALDRVFSTLMELKHGGRLIGIISHVEELRQRIDLRLEISTHPSYGSWLAGSAAASELGSL